MEEIVNWYFYDLSYENISYHEFTSWLYETFPDKESDFKFVQFGKKVWFKDKDHVTLCQLRWE